MVIPFREGKFLGGKPPQARDPLLSVEDLQHPVLLFDEIEKSKGVPLEDRLNDGDLFLAVILGIKVVALVLGLDDEPPVESEEPFALVLVVDESLDDVPHRVLRP